MLLLLSASLLACDSQDGGSQDDGTEAGGKSDDAACDPTLVCAQAETCVDGLLYATTCGPQNCSEPIEDARGVCQVDDACDPWLFCGQAQTCVDGQLYPTTCGPDNCDAPVVDPLGACEGEGSEGDAEDPCHAAALAATASASLSLSDGRAIYGQTTIMSTNRIGEPSQERQELRLQLFVDGVTNADPQQRFEACRDLDDAALAELLAPTIEQVFGDPRCVDDPACNQLEPLPVGLVETDTPMTFTGERSGCASNDLSFSVDMFGVDPFWSGPFACGSAFCLADIPVAQDASTIPNQIASSTLQLLVADGLFADMHDPSTTQECEAASQTRQSQSIEYVGPRDSNVCQGFREDYEPESC